MPPPSTTARCPWRYSTSTPGASCAWPTRTGLLDGRDDDAEDEDDDESRRALARELAVAATVLLTNDGVLPLPSEVGPIAVIGPNAELLAIGGGGSAQVLPHRHLSLVDELRARLPGTTVTHHPGCRLGTALPPIDPRLLAGGVRVDAYAAGEDGSPTGDALTSELLSTGYFLSFGSPVPHRPLSHLAFRGTGTVEVPTSGRWRLGIANAGEARLWLDGELLVENTEDTGRDFFFGMGFGTKDVEVDLVAGRPYDVRIDLTPQPGLPVIGLRLHGAAPEATTPSARPSPRRRPTSHWWSWAPAPRPRPRAWTGPTWTWWASRTSW